MLTMSDPMIDKTQNKPPENNWRNKLYIIIFEADTPAGKLFDEVLIFTILLSVIVVIPTYN
ncbi:hypothetical protein ACSAZL_08275 [Methanosarcina sp. T3]|uniref:hypothetical protein n=1 Tax=Methanosarcina sp. T3 TaxID=3439062 RepID=UPI003F838339